MMFVTFGVMWLFLTSLWFGLQCVIVVVSGHSHFLLLIHSFKIQHKGGIGAIM